MEEHDLWRRSKEEQYKTGIIILENSFKPRFTQLDANTFVDTQTKGAALTVSPSVVGLISYYGDKKICWASGIVVECNMVNAIFFGTILTSASLLRPNGSEDFHPKELKIEVVLPDGGICGSDIFSFDFHYNLCAITIKSSSHLPTIKLRCVDDTIETIDAKERSFQLRAHSNLLKLFPGDKLVAVGRYHSEPYELVVAPGKYSIDRCGFDCKELLRVNCKITKCGIGGPMINIYGEVVGINFYDEKFTPFLPMNVVCKWWEFIKCCRNEEYSRLLLGMQVNTLYSAEVAELEIIMRKFPEVLKGIIVEELYQHIADIITSSSGVDYNIEHLSHIFRVTPGSPAAVAGICSDDVIVQFGGEEVQSCLQLFEITWDKVGKGVDLAIRRASTGENINLNMVVGCVDDATQFHRWPLPSEKWVHSAYK